MNLTKQYPDRYLFNFAVIVALLGLFISTQAYFMRTRALEAEARANYELRRRVRLLEDDFAALHKLYNLSRTETP